MTMTDPIADFLTRIRNAISARPRRRRDPGVEVEDGDRARPRRAGLHRELQRRAGAASASVLRVKLKYTEDRRSVISGLQRVSRPGRRTVRRTPASCRRCWAAWAPRS